MSNRKFICKQGWVRHPKGTIINEWEWLKINYETRDQHFEEYFETEPEEIKVSEKQTEFTEDLSKELEKRGVSARFKPKVVDGKTELDATFTFDKNDG